MVTVRIAGVGAGWLCALAPLNGPSQTAIRPPASTRSRIAGVMIFIVREVFRPNIHVIGRRVYLELHGVDHCTPLGKCFRNAVHSVHHRTICREDDRKAELGFHRQLAMVNERPPCRGLPGAERGLIELADLTQRDGSNRKIAR